MALAIANCTGIADAMQAALSERSIRSHKLVLDIDIAGASLKILS